MSSYPFSSALLFQFVFHHPRIRFFNSLSSRWRSNLSAEPKGGYPSSWNRLWGSSAHLALFSNTFRCTFYCCFWSTATAMHVFTCSRSSSTSEWLLVSYTDDDDDKVLSADGRRGGSPVTAPSPRILKQFLHPFYVHLY